MIRFVRDVDEPGLELVDMRVTARQPFCRLSFDYQHGQIPVEHMVGMYSETVTGLMEALKLVGRRGRRGHVNVGYLVGPGRERVVAETEWVSGYLYDGRPVDLAEARRCILIPAYCWVLTHRVGDVVAAVRSAAEVRAVGLYDGFVSADVGSPERLSAAAVLSAYLNGRLAELQAGTSLDH